MGECKSFPMTPNRGGLGSQHAGGQGCYLEEPGQTEVLNTGLEKKLMERLASLVAGL